MDTWWSHFCIHEIRTKAGHICLLSRSTPQRPKTYRLIKELSPKIFIISRSRSTTTMPPPPTSLMSLMLYPTSISTMPSGPGLEPSDRGRRCRNITSHRTYSLHKYNFILSRISFEDHRSSTDFHTDFYLVYVLKRVGSENNIVQVLGFMIALSSRSM